MTDSTVNCDCSMPVNKSAYTRCNKHFWFSKACRYQYSWRHKNICCCKTNVVMGYTPRKVTLENKNKMILEDKVRKAILVKTVFLLFNFVFKTEAEIGCRLPTPCRSRRRIARNEIWRIFRTVKNCFCFFRLFRFYPFFVDSLFCCLRADSVDSYVSRSFADSVDSCVCRLFRCFESIVATRR